MVIKNKISACLVVYNEEKLIERCLMSIKDVVDEIIVVHDGKCNDNTLNICFRYTKKVFVREHVGVAEAHRPFSYRKANGDWILQIDADEYLSDKLKKKLKLLIKNNSIDAYELLWPYWDGEKYLTKNWPYKRVLFNKKKVSVLGIPNAVVEVKGKIKKIDLRLEHEPNYNNFTWNCFRKKWINWAKLQAIYYLKNFQDIDKFNYKKNTWSKKVKIRIKHPLLLVPFEFIITFYKNIVNEGWTGNWLIKFKVAIMLGLYRVLVNYYIYKYE